MTKLILITLLIFSLTLMYILFKKYKKLLDNNNLTSAISYNNILCDMSEFEKQNTQENQNNQERNNLSCDKSVPSALDAAKYLIGLGQRDGNPITNLRLQKLLYYAWGTYWNLYKKHLFNDPIEAWQFGPVIREVYIEYCDSKKDELTLNSETIALTDKKINKSIKEFLQAFFEKYKDISTYALIKGSHEEAPWKETYKVSEKNIISQEKMEKFFNTIN